MNILKKISIQNASLIVAASLAVSMFTAPEAVAADKHVTVNAMVCTANYAHCFGAKECKSSGGKVSYKNGGKWHQAAGGSICQIKYIENNLTMRTMARVPAASASVGPASPPKACPTNTVTQPNGTCLANSRFSFGPVARYKARPIQKLAPVK